jgi:hypothetical protein
MARDILALPCSIDCKVASRTAIIAITESRSNYWVEELVCVQDWLKPAGRPVHFMPLSFIQSHSYTDQNSHFFIGTTAVESSDDL